jgi:hypothetical protein
LREWPLRGVEEETTEITGKYFLYTLAVFKYECFWKGEVLEREIAEAHCANGRCAGLKKKPQRSQVNIFFIQLQLSGMSVVERGRLRERIQRRFAGI